MEKILMNEKCPYKEGDEVYFLIEELGWGSLPLSVGNLNIRKEKITEIVDGWDDGYILSTENIYGSFRGDCCAFSSKKELIYYLKSKIKELERE